VEKSIPTVSVVIPTYNRAHVVGQAINSVLHQTYQDFEIFIIDDASTDNTEEVVKGFSDPRIHYLRQQQNRGAPWSRNLGAEVARGKYLAFLDSDDLWYPEFLERQLAVLNDFPPDVGMICCGMVRKQGESRSVIIPSAPYLTFDGNLMQARGGHCSSSLMVRRAAFQTIGGFDVNFSSFQDFDFLLRMSANYRVEASDEILMEYRLGKDSISVNMDKKAKGLERIINIYQRDILRLGVMHRYLFWLGQYHVLSGNLATGWRRWARALRYKVLDAKIWKHVLLSLGGVGLYRRALLLHNRRMEQQYTQ
jgi:glycosyltransferase involved in cell wall biosynthesis